MDTRGHYDASALHNMGFKSRRDIFIESKTATTPDKFKKNPTPIWGALTTDFDTLKKGKRLG